MSQKIHKLLAFIIKCVQSFLNTVVLRAATAKFWQVRMPVAATSFACHRCRRRFLFYKIQARPRPWLPCQPWLPHQWRVAAADIACYFAKSRQGLGSGGLAPLPAVAVLFLLSRTVKRSKSHLENFFSQQI